MGRRLPLLVLAITAACLVGLMLYRPFLFRRLLPEPVYLRIYNWRWRSHWQRQDHYLRLLQSPSADRRFFAASALSGYDSPFDVPLDVLTSVMENDPDPSVRRVCVASLPAEAQVVSAWHRMLRADTAASVRWWIIETATGLQNNDGFLLLLEALGDRDEGNAERAFGQLCAVTGANVPPELRPQRGGLSDEELFKLRSLFARSKQ